MRKTTPEHDTPLDETPAVAEMKSKLDEAQAELVAAEAELNHLNRILDPLPASSDHTPNTSELDALRAQQELPVVRARHLMAKSAVLELKPRYQATRHEALQMLMAHRSATRSPLLRKYADALDQAAAIGYEILAFDQETVRLGGSSPGHPFAQLIDEPPYRMGDATRVRQSVNELEGR